MDLSMLNEYQLEAVTSDSDKIVCLAGAGTGKTLSLIKRVEYQISQGIDPDSILVLTFTNAAAFEMRDRYTSNSNKIPEFRTFHAFCYNLLISDNNFRKILGYRNIPSILSPEEEKSLNKELMVTLGLKKISSETDGLIFSKAKMKKMRERDVITFDILCKSICSLFKSDVKSVQKYKERYKCIYVDEFQDCDQIQWDFVQSFKNSSIFVVGDILQNIYSFRGTTNDIIKSLVDDKDWTVIKLVENYRSTGRIVDYANEFSKYSDDSYRLNLHTSRDIGCPVNEYEGNAYNFLSEDIQTFLKTSDDVAILCRTNKEVNVIKQNLKNLNIPIVQNLDEDIIRYIKSSKDIDYGLNWLSSYLSIEDYSTYIAKTIENNESFTLDEFLFSFKNSYTLNKKGSILKQYIELKSNSGEDVEKFKNGVDSLFNLSDSNLYLDDSLLTVEDTESYILHNLTKQHAHSGIYVGTIHSTKGLEYENVIIVGVGSKVFSLSSEDNKNLFYVAITRAKNTLTVFKG